MKIELLASAAPLGVSRAMFPSVPGPHVMLRGPAVTYAPEQEGGAGAEGASEGEGAAEGGESEDAGDGAEGEGEAAGTEEGAEGQEGGEEGAGGEGGGAEAAAAAEGAEGDGEGETKPKRVPWQTKRIDALTAQKNAATAEADRLRAENEALRALKGEGDGAGGEGDGKTTPPAKGKLYTEEEANRLADQKAAVRLLSQKADACYDDAAALDPGFQARLPAMREAVGETLASRSVEFFEAVTRLDNGGAVLNELTKDLDHFAELLELGPSAMGIELAKMDGRLGKPKERQISRAGASARPVRPVQGAAGQDRGYEDLSDDEYARKRSEEREAHRARGG